MKLFIRLGLFLTLISALNANAGTSFGTGFFVTNDGYIATNNHVIDADGNISVRLQNGKRLPARIIRTDPNNDLAIIKIDGVGYKSVNLQPSSVIERGTKSYVLGFPLPTLQGIESKLTDGIISSLSGERDQPTTFQISNPIQPGNSGGPLFTEDGKVVGVVVSTLSTLETTDMTKRLTQNINYAVKSAYLLEMLKSIDNLKYKQNLSAPATPSKKLVEVVQQINKSIVLIIIDSGNTPSVKQQETQLPAEKQPQSPIPPTTKELSACDKAWNALVDTKQVNNLKILVDNDCGRIHSSGWLSGQGVSNPGVCRPPWFSLEDSKMLDNVGTLLMRDCPVMNQNGIHIKK